MKKTSIINTQLSIIFAFCLLPFVVFSQTDHSNVTQDVLQRLMGSRAKDVKIIILPSQTSEAKVTIKKNKINVVATDPVCAIYGVYTYLKNNGFAMVSWSGKSVVLPEKFPNGEITVKSPFANRYYFNVVTYGYTMPYWDFERWQQEIDWMAIHGINMPLALVATEAIGERVWKKLGLTQEEIDIFYTAPAHLPWQRMGNITKHDGPLTENWHKQQIEMQHKILNQMRALGMKPIAPAFAGFVPKDLKRIYPEMELNQLLWGGFPDDKQASLLSPYSPLFAQIGKLFIEEWEKEFGENEFYIADSFNEMELPKSEKPVTDLLADYGDAVYQSIKTGNKEAVWVVQGWMFGYQRYIWSTENVQALFSKIPNDKLFILDEACDYNGTFWKNEMNYKFYDGFSGKPYGIGFIPNMGGKTGWTGIWDFYASCPIDALNYPKKGALMGYGVCPEGIENNEMLYEFLADIAWQSEKIDIQEWVKKNALARYGSFTKEIEAAWGLFLRSSYNTFTDHPRLGWQYLDFGGSLHRSDDFLLGIETFLSCAEIFEDEALYKNDALDLAAAYLGIKADEWFTSAKKAHDENDFQTRDLSLNLALELLTKADLILESHPNLRLERWIDFARGQGSNLQEKDKYEANARRIVTVWGPPVNDYSARVWSGLIRDFYRQRMKAYFAALSENRTFNRAQWEENWVQAKGVSKVTPLDKPLQKAKEWVNEAKNIAK